MPAEILIPCVVGLVVALLFLSLLTRRRPRHSPRLVRASLESSMSVSQPEVRSLPVAPQTERQQRSKSRPERQPTVTSELPLDIESTMPLGYTAAKSMRSQTRSAPLFVTAPPTKKKNKAEAPEAVIEDKAETETSSAAATELQATAVVKTIEPVATVVGPAKEPDVESIGTESEISEQALADTVEKIEQVVLDPPHGESTSLIESEIETEVITDATSETEADTGDTEIVDGEQPKPVASEAATDSAVSEIDAEVEIETAFVAVDETPEPIEQPEAAERVTNTADEPITEPTISLASVLPIVTKPTVEIATSVEASTTEKVETTDTEEADIVIAEPDEAAAEPLSELDTIPQRTSIPTVVHRLPAEVCQRFSALNQRLDRLEDSIEQLETQFKGFDLDFDSPAHLSSVEAASESEEDEGTIAA